MTATDNAEKGYNLNGYKAFIEPIIFQAMRNARNSEIERINKILHEAWIEFREYGTAEEVITYIRKRLK